MLLVRSGWLKRGPRDSGSLGRQLPDLNKCTLKKVSIQEHGNKGRNIELIRKTAKALNRIHLQCGMARERSTVSHKFSGVNKI